MFTLDVSHLAGALRLTGIARNARRVARALIGRDLFLLVDINCAKERFGSLYGGWEVMTDQLCSETIVYSFGVGEDATFDLSLIERFGLKVQAFDPTPRSAEWVRGRRFPANFIFHEVGLADFDGIVSFYGPENPEHVSHTILEIPSRKAGAIDVPVKRLSTIKKELGHDAIDILKMDIEGAEYSAIDDMKNSGLRPKQVLVEFHHRFSGVGVDRTKHAVRTLREMGYALFSISESGEEFSFLYIK